jgi:predicted anti-sigma-YlaC factor YlaD
MNISGKECARARESVSADLDRELHELDHRRLQAHLRDCADCSAWAERVRATTAQLREARAEPSTAAVFHAPRRDRARRVGSALVLAPAAALAASLIFSLGLAHGLLSGQRTTSTPLSPTDRNLMQNSRSIDMYRLSVMHGVLRV